MELLNVADDCVTVTLTPQELYFLKVALTKEQLARKKKWEEGTQINTLEMMFDMTAKDTVTEMKDKVVGLMESVKFSKVFN